LQGKGHHTPQAILLGFEGADPETIDTGTIPSRYNAILENKTLMLHGEYKITYDMGDFCRLPCNRPRN
jgi:hypothetical protein